MVDQIGRTRQFPGQAQITGLLGNALGYDHAGCGGAGGTAGPAAVRGCAGSRPGEPLRDYQTVDLGRPICSDTGWTTRVPAGNSCRRIRRDNAYPASRWYRADALVSSRSRSSPADAPPRLTDLAAALDRPARPLFIGRKTACRPRRFGSEGQARSMRWRRCWKRCARLERSAPGDGRHGSLSRSTHGSSRNADRASAATEEADRLVDRRDWRNQIHTGAPRGVSVRLGSEPTAESPNQPAHASSPGDPTAGIYWPQPRAPPRRASTDRGRSGLSRPRAVGAVLWGTGRPSHSNSPRRRRVLAGRASMGASRRCDAAEGTARGAGRKRQSGAAAEAIAWDEAEAANRCRLQGRAAASLPGERMPDDADRQAASALRAGRRGGPLSGADRSGG